MTPNHSKLFKQYEKYINSKPDDEDIFKHYLEYSTKYPDEDYILLAEAQNKFLDYAHYFICKLTNDQVLTLLACKDEPLIGVEDDFMAGMISDILYIYRHGCTNTTDAFITFLLSREGQENNVNNLIEYICICIVLFIYAGYYANYKDATDDLLIDVAWDLTELESNKEDTLILPILKSKIPDKYFITNNKLSNEMTKGFLNEGELELVVSSRNVKKEIINYCTLTYDSEDIKLSGRQQFTAYDRAVHNAVCSLYVAGNTVFTPEMVYRTMTGMTESEKPHKQAIHAVSESIEKSRSTKLTIDLTRSAASRNLYGVKPSMDDMLLSTKRVTVLTGGYKKEAYTFNSKPILYEYSQSTKQIIAVPLTLLDTKEAISNTAEIIPIKEYLIRRIEIMRHNKNMNNKITYDAIFYEVGISDPNAKKRLYLRNNIKSILNLWKNKEYIKNFDEYKDGKSIKGILIIY